MGTTYVYTEKMAEEDGMSDLMGKRTRLHWHNAADGMWYADDEHGTRWIASRPAHAARPWRLLRGDRHLGHFFTLADAKKEAQRLADVPRRNLEHVFND